MTAALEGEAERRGLAPSTLARELVADGLFGHGQSTATPAAPAQSHEAGPPAPPTRRKRPSAAWLRLGRGEKWQLEMWDAAQRLRETYPDLAASLPRNWVEDAFARDGVFALAVWRRDIDSGVHTDPRLEHQWLGALRDFRRMLDERRGSLGPLYEREARPGNW